MVEEKLQMKKTGIDLKFWVWQMQPVLPSEVHVGCLGKE